MEKWWNCEGNKRVRLVCLHFPMGSRILFLAELVALHSIFIAQYSVAMFDHSSHGSFIEPQFAPAVFCWIISCQVGWQCNIYPKDGMSFSETGPAFTIWSWWLEPPIPRMGNPVQLIFYLIFMLYLILTSLQMRPWQYVWKVSEKMFHVADFIEFTSQFFPEFSRYDVHVTSGGLALTHSMDFISNLAFKAQASHCWHCIRCGHFGQILCWRFVKAYLAVPFVEEMRVLTDWTITRSYQLGFFMHMNKKKFYQFSNKNLFEIKKHTTKNIFGLHCCKVREVFSFFESLTHGPQVRGDFRTSMDFFMWMKLEDVLRRFFSAMWIHFI